MANSVDPDQMPYSVPSDLGLHCLLKTVFPKTWSRSKYGNLIKSIALRNHPGSSPVRADNED